MMPSASVEEELLSTLHPSPLVSAIDLNADCNEHTARGKLNNAGAEDAARELEDSLLGTRPKSMRKDPLKRPAEGALSDISSDLEVPIPMDKPTNKKRRMDKDATAIADELERAVDDASLSPTKTALPKAKGKVKYPQLREASVDSTSNLSLTPKGRKKTAAKKKLDALLIDHGSAAGSVNGDATPSASRPVSPALTATSTVVYELDEVVPPLKRAKKMDENAMVKRLKTLEETQRKAWTNIARRDIAKVRKGVNICTPYQCFFRYTSMRHWDTKQGKVSSRGLPCLRLCKHADHSPGRRKQAKRSRLRRSGLCERCLFFGRKTSGRRGTFASVNRRRPLTERRLRKRSARRHAKRAS